jgi:RNA processing factor Prp31
MNQYWPYASPMPHTPVYQPVQETSDIYSKLINQSLKSRNECFKNYMEDLKNHQNIRKIVRHTIGEEQPHYDIKNILKHLKNIYKKQNVQESATVVKTE